MKTSLIDLDEKKEYFFVISHESKFLSIGDSLRRALQKRNQKEISPIYVLPNLPPDYFQEQYIVVNEFLESRGLFSGSEKYNYMPDPRDFQMQASRDPMFADLLKKIAMFQDKILVFPILNVGLDLESVVDEVKVMAPKKDAVMYLDDKINQRALVESLGVKVPAGQTITEGKDALIKAYLEKHVPSLGEPAYVGLAKGQGGSGSFLIDSIGGMRDVPAGDRYLLLERLDLEKSLTINSLAAEDRNIPVGISEMVMDGPKYRGTISLMDEKLSERILDETEKIYSGLRSLGYLGIFNVDFMVDKNNNLYFTEINPRKGGSIPELAVGWEKSNSGNSLFEMEMDTLEGISVPEKEFSMNLFPYGMKIKKVDKGYVSRNGNHVPKSIYSLFEDRGLEVYDYLGETRFLNNSKLAKIVYLPGRESIQVYEGNGLSAHILETLNEASDNLQ